MESNLHEIALHDVQGEVGGAYEAEEEDSESGIHIEYPTMP